MVLRTLLPGDGPHRVDADDTGAGRVEQCFAADFAASDEVAEELSLPGGQTDVESALAR